MGEREGREREKNTVLGNPYEQYLPAPGQAGQNRARINLIKWPGADTAAARGRRARRAARHAGEGERRAAFSPRRKPAAARFPRPRRVAQLPEKGRR